MIKILHILSSLDGGGVEAMITNYYVRFPKNEIVFDFIVHNPKTGILEEDLQKRGSKIFHVTPKKEGIFKNIKELNAIIDAKEYDAIYCHQNFISWIPLLIAKRKGIKVRIVHSHGCNPPKTITKKLYNGSSRMLIKLFATHFFACGQAAAHWLYGPHWKENGTKKKIIHNAIDLDKFAFSKETRQKLRKKYNVTKDLCIFHAGRFSYEKNHKFILDLFSKLPKEGYHLFLAGHGDLYPDMVKYSKKLKLENVTFLGIRKDVNELYSMADVFLLPSFHEGFPVTLVEAQASSLKCIASTNVSKETKILPKTKYLSLEDTNSWLEEIKNTDRKDRRTERKRLIESGFDIQKESDMFYHLLKEIVNK